MPEVTLYFTIEHSDHFGSGELWTKTIKTPFLPRKGDEMMIFDWAGSHNDGPLVFVDRPYWNTDGTVCVQFEKYVVDPNDQMEEQIRLSIRTDHPLHGWYTDRDGDLRNFLRTSGWQDYSARRGR